MRISSNGPHADNSLCAFFELALRRLGARVEFTREENLVLRVGDIATVPEPLPSIRVDGAPPVSVLIRVEGLPNLLHEVGHLVLRRVLDHDHGIDYGQIPFDMRQASGRAVLWEEMACCTLSCGFSRTLQSSADWAWADGWFAEQVEIQPVFYGMQDDPEGFWSAVAEMYHDDAVAAEAVVSRAFEKTEALLRWAGAPAGVARPCERLSFGTLLHRARPGLDCDGSL